MHKQSESAILGIDKCLLIKLLFIPGPKETRFDEGTGVTFSLLPPDKRDVDCTTHYLKCLDKLDEICSAQNGEWQACTPCT